MPPNLVKGKVPEMSCVLATGNLPEILPYTVPGNVKKMSKFPGVGNVHIMNRKCELSCTFHGISWPRKFRISSSEQVLTNGTNPASMYNLSISDGIHVPSERDYSCWTSY